jgi:DNA repair ATPase RecN
MLEKTIARSVAKEKASAFESLQGQLNELATAVQTLATNWNSILDFVQQTAQSLEITQRQSFAGQQAFAYLYSTNEEFKKQVNTLMEQLKKKDEELQKQMKDEAEQERQQNERVSEDLPPQA